MDLFATPEAGSVYHKGNGIVAWVPSEELCVALPEDFQYPQDEDAGVQP